MKKKSIPANLEPRYESGNRSLYLSNVRDGAALIFFAHLEVDIGSTMNTIALAPYEAQAATALQGLANRIDTPALDEFILQLISMAGDLEQGINCEFTDERIRITVNQRLLHELELPRGKSILRMVCARLAVQCEEWTNQPVKPYGDQVSVEMPSEKRPFLIAFENTPVQQMIAIELP
jgi:hypothetical protein